MESNHYSEAPCFMNIPSGFYQLELMAPCGGKYRIRTDKQSSVSFKLAHIPIYQCPCFTIRLTSLKMSSLMTCSGHDGRIVYGLIQVGDFISTSQIQLKYGSLMRSGAPGEPGCNKKSVHLSSRTGVFCIHLYQ